MTDISQAPVPPLESPHHIHVLTFAHHRNKSLHKVSPSEPTNTYALLLPSSHLFAPAILSVLYDFYSGYGRIRTWAPVRGLGRAIVVFEDEDEGERARKEGGWFEVGGPGSEVGAELIGIGNEESFVHDSVKEQMGTNSGSSSPNGKDYINARRQTRKNSILIRLLPLPPTSLNPPSQHLLPPPAPLTNTLISPPGSPPEGWEPAEEEGPNKETLAEDLVRALEEVRLNGRGYAGKGRRGSWRDQEGDGEEGEQGMDGHGQQVEDDKEIILETDDGVMFTVQAPPDSEQQTLSFASVSSFNSDHAQPDPTEERHVYQNVPDESYGGGRSGWRTPGLGETTFSGSGAGTPGGFGRIGSIRTARPPLAPSSSNAA